MIEFFRKLIYQIADLHDLILHLNDSFEANLTDKQLHFLVFGAAGLLLLLLTYPVFYCLHRKNKILAIAWIYTFTLIVILSFAIEFGQHFSGTGNMDLADVIAGVGGFLAITAVIAVIRLIWWVLKEIWQAIFQR